MKAMLLGMTAGLACPAIGFFLLLAWRFSWLARSPSLPWMLAAIALSIWAVYAVKQLTRLATKRSRIVADKIGVALVAIGILWIAFLGLSTPGTFKMFKTTARVERVENGRAWVAFVNRHGAAVGGELPELDGFSKLHVGEEVSVLNEWKTTELFSRAVAFTVLGAATGALLILGGLIARRNAAQPCAIPFKGFAGLNRLIK